MIRFAEASRAASIIIISSIRWASTARRQFERERLGAANRLGVAAVGIAVRERLELDPRAPCPAPPRSPSRAGGGSARNRVAAAWSASQPRSGTYPRFRAGMVSPEPLLVGFPRGRASPSSERRIVLLRGMEVGESPAGRDGRPAGAAGASRLRGRAHPSSERQRRAHEQPFGRAPGQEARAGARGGAPIRSR